MGAYVRCYELDLLRLDAWCCYSMTIGLLVVIEAWADNGLPAAWCVFVRLCQLGLLPACYELHLLLAA